MVDEAKLSAVLSEFARTLATEFPIQEILDHLVARIVEVLPVTSAGVTLIGERREPRFVAASDATALRYERLQTGLGEGPCVVAFDAGEPVAVADLAQEARFPAFTAAARAAGLGAVFAFPLHHGDRRLGALDLYREAPGPLDVHTMATAQTLADVAAAYLINAQSREDARIAAEQLRVRALHDPLTGLANRALLQDRLQHAAERAQRSGEHVGVLFVDLDGFKRVNDTYGHHVGDELLVAVAGRLAALVRAGDTLARLAGDEFVFLCEGLTGPEDVEVLADRVGASFRAPFRVAEVELALTASVGVAVAGPDESITSALLVQADAAMYTAKRGDRWGVHRLGPLDVDGSSLVSQLRAALDDDELEVRYQPIVRCAEGRLSGVEAVLRWTHPSRGPVPPSIAVAVAERGGLAADLGAWLLRRSCEDHRRWRAAHPDVLLELALDVPVPQLLSPGLVVLVAAALAASGTEPSALTLEVPEDVLTDDIGRATVVCQGLRDTGVRLALDGFGTGASSLRQLRNAPVDAVKLHRSLVADVDQVPGADAVLAAMTNVAHVLSLSVTASGVETRRQHEAVGASGCVQAQGPFYAPSMSAAGIASLLVEGRDHLPVDAQPSARRTATSMLPRVALE